MSHVHYSYLKRITKEINALLKRRCESSPMTKGIVAEYRLTRCLAHRSGIENRAGLERFSWAPRTRTRPPRAIFDVPG
jgi:hypothetical protein